MKGYIKIMKQSPYEVIEDQRPWGKFRQYTHNQPTTVKIITVKFGEQLSVQRHRYRDELWIAFDPGLVALIGDETIFMNPQTQEPVYIPRKTIHSIKNVSLIESARFLEIAFGHFDEADIERFKDKYGRV